MKTLKELKETMNKYWYSEEYKIAYQNWYKTAIEWILNDITNSWSISVESIEKYLKDLLNN